MAGLHYDPSLQERLNCGNNTGIPPVLNGSFSSWQGNIVNIMQENYREEDTFYQEAANSELFAACQEHEAEHSRGLATDNIIMLTHPFYLSLNHMHRVKRGKKKEAKTYLDNVMLLLDSQIDREHTSILILETAHHYAAVTSLLLEDGMVDKVVFTRATSGHFIDIGDIRPFADRTFYIGGGYNYRCLSQSINELGRIVENDEQLWVVKGLCINAPFDNNSLFPDIVDSRHTNSSRYIGLKRLLRKFGKIRAKD